MEGCCCLEGESPSIKISNSCSSEVLPLFAPLELASGSLGLCQTENLSDDVRFSLHFNTCLE